MRIEIRGKENLSGLTNELDVTAIPLLFPFFSKYFPVYYVADSRERFTTFGWRNYIYGGIFFNILGGYSIHPGFHDYGISLQDHMDLIEKGQTVFIFPEGKRTGDGKLCPARGGLGYMVHKTEVSVVPVAINTFHGISPWSYFTFQRRVVITILPVMTPEEIINVENPTVEDFRAGSQKVLDRISKSL